MILAVVALPPLAAAALSLIPGRRTLAPVSTSAAALLVLLAALGVAQEVAQRGRIVAVPEWVACDGLSALLVVLVAVVGAAAALFSWGYIGVLTSQHDPEAVRRYYTNFNLFLFSLLVVPLLLELALVWIAVELTTLLSVFLVSFENTQAALEAAWKYVVLTLMGASVAVLGFLMLYWGLRAAGGTSYTWEQVRAAAPAMSPRLVQTAFLLILVGFGAKAGLVPLHTWLPDAHSQAPSPVCALLSGVETSVVLYAILRLVPVVALAPGLHAEAWTRAFGLLSVGVAAFLLIQASDYKRLFAFSTVEHMGIILAATAIGGSFAGYAAAYQLLSHALTKAFCFFAAGAAFLGTRTREIAAVHGLVRRSPVAGAALLLAGLAIAGAPPFTVFLSEFTILRAGLGAGQLPVVALLALFIAIGFFAVMAHVNRMVFGRPAAEGRASPLPATCVLALLGAAAPVVALGLFMPGSLYALLRVAASALAR